MIEKKVKTTKSAISILAWHIKSFTMTLLQLCMILSVSFRGALEPRAHAVTATFS